MLQNYDTILFDADRTLFDTAAGEKAALRAVMKTIKQPFSEDMPQVYTQINEALWKKLELGQLSFSHVQKERWRKFQEAFGLTGNPMQFNQMYLAFFSQCHFLMPHAEEVCKALCRRKKLYIITNGTSRVQRERFANSKISACFLDFFISEDIGIPKPQWGFFYYVLTHIKLSKANRVLIVGDSLSSDIQGGNNAKIDTCWYNPDGLENESGAVPTYEIHDLMELLQTPQPEGTEE